jgi:hypothetical protein
VGNDQQYLPMIVAGLIEYFRSTKPAAPRKSVLERIRERLAGRAERRKMVDAQAIVRKPVL